MSRGTVRRRSPPGASTKTSQVISGSGWLPDMKAMTSRPTVSWTSVLKRSLMTSWNIIRCSITMFRRPAVKQRLFDAGEATAQDADDDVVDVVDAGLVRAAAVVLLEEADEPVGELSAELAAPRASRVSDVAHPDEPRTSEL